MRKQKLTKSEWTWLIAAVVSVVMVAALTACMVVFLVLDWTMSAAPVEVEAVVDEVVTEELERTADAEELVGVAPVEQEATGRLLSIGEFDLTAYCSCEKCCGVWAKNRPVDEMGNEIVYGASGNRLFANRSVAVDPSVIPYGMELVIDGLRYAAHDCGGAIKGNRIDVYFDSHEEALQFGRQTKTVYVEEVF